MKSYDNIMFTPLNAKYLKTIEDTKTFYSASCDG